MFMSKYRKYIHHFNHNIVPSIQEIIQQWYVLYKNNSNEHNLRDVLCYIFRNQGWCWKMGAFIHWLYLNETLMKTNWVQKYRLESLTNIIVWLHQHQSNVWSKFIIYNITWISYTWLIDFSFNDIFFLFHHRIV